MSGLLCHCRLPHNSNPCTSHSHPTPKTSPQFHKAHLGRGSALATVFLPRWIETHLINVMPDGSFKSELDHVFLSPSPSRWNGHFQSKANPLIYCVMKQRHLGLKRWLAFQERQAFLSLRGMKQTLKLQLELADRAGGKASLPCMRLPLGCSHLPCSE